MQIALFSFGFKHGHCPADLVWDVRFLPNPYWVPALKSHNGLETEVADYVLANAAGARFLALLEPLLIYLVEQYTASGRERLTIAVGCTGGKHRSVAVTERIASFLKASGSDVTVTHRDIAKE